MLIFQIDIIINNEVKFQNKFLYLYILYAKSEHCKKYFGILSRRYTCDKFSTANQMQDKYWKFKDEIFLDLSSNPGFNR